jgi:MFS family permease
MHERDQRGKTVRGRISPTSTAAALPASFQRLVLAWAGSLTGDGLRVIALPLLAVSVNPSAAAVAAVAVASTLPWLLVAIPAGALVDRLNPAKVMAAAHLVRALLTIVLVALVVTGGVTIALLCAVGFAITSAETFADGSAQSLLVRIVPRPHLERANARFVTVETLALDLAGPLAAGVLFLAAPWAPFAVSAGCFLVAAATVGTIRAPVIPGRTSAPARVRDMAPAEHGDPISTETVSSETVSSENVSSETVSSETVTTETVGTATLGAVPVVAVAGTGDAGTGDVGASDVGIGDVGAADVASGDSGDSAIREEATGFGASASAKDPSANRSGPFAPIRAGLARLISDQVLRVLVITVAIMVIANASTDAVLVLYGTETLGMSEAFYPTLLVAYSIGTLIAATLVGRRNSRLRGGQVMMVALFGISATMFVLGFFPNVVAALIAYAVMGLAGGTWNVLSATRRQRRTPHAMIGRVSSAFRVVAWGVIPIGAAVGGLVGERFGVTSVFVLAGSVIAVLGLFVVRSFVTTEPDQQPASR